MEIIQLDETRTHTFSEDECKRVILWGWDYSWIDCIAAHSVVTNLAALVIRYARPAAQHVNSPGYWVFFIRPGSNSLMVEGVGLRVFDNELAQVTTHKTYSRSLAGWMQHWALFHRKEMSRRGLSPSPVIRDGGAIDVVY